MSNPFFDHPILNSPYEVPSRIGSWTRTGSRPKRSSKAAAGRVHHANPEAEEAQASGHAEGNRLRRGQGAFDQGAAVRPDLDHQRGPRPRGRMACAAEPAVSGRSRRRLPGCSSTGGTTSSATFARSSARSRRRKRRSGSPRSRRNRSSGKRLLDHLAAANKDANPDLMRLALKLATGAGKTTVMAMLIAWQTINAVRRPGSKTFHARLPGRALPA